jgi:anaerobic magnesium-protoporphyrin IX monomethyl ester cyclase
MSDSKDIILVSPPPGWQGTLPIGLGFLAAYVTKNGFSSVIYDMALDMSEKIRPEEYKYLWGLKAKNLWLDPDVFKLFTDKYEKEISSCVDYILSFKPKVIGFSVIHSKQLITLETARRIKEQAPSSVIIAGGPACFYDEDRHMLESDGTIDAFVSGEGEESLLDILTNIKNNLPLDGIKGVRASGSLYKRYSPRPVINDLDKIPFPDYPGLMFEKYNSFSIPLFGSRGCFGSCSFCEIRNVWKNYRSRSADNIFNEIRFYAEEKNITRFSFFDSVLNGNPSILKMLCDKIIDSGHKISWEGNIAALPGMNENIYSKMAKAGCEIVYFGLETGSERVAGLMKKPFTVLEAERNIMLAHDAGIATSVNFITGFPGESEEDFQKTLDFVGKNSRYIDRADFITECQVARGTDLFLHPDDYGMIIPEKWDGYKWYTMDGKNTLSSRQEMTLRLGRCLASAGVKINMNFNLDDGAAEIKDTLIDSLGKD